jgi:hypothetical protein
MIDWNVELTKIYLDKNIGMDAISDLTFQKVFESEDRIIFLEEDIFPSLSFFRFCDELLEKYLNDERVFLIGGMNGLDEYPNYPTKNPSYFFVNTCSTWGMATWRRTYLKLQKDFSVLDNIYYDNAIKALMARRKKFHHYQKMRFLKDNPQATILRGELYFMGFNQNILHNSLSIIPSKNLILNLGNSEGAEHSDKSLLLPKTMRYLDLMTLHELEFPLIHPEFMIVDYYYSLLRSRLNPKGNIVIRVFIKISRGIRILVYGGPKRFWSKFKKFIIRYWTLERKLKKYK